MYLLTFNREKSVFSGRVPGKAELFHCPLKILPLSFRYYLYQHMRNLLERCRDRCVSPNQQSNRMYRHGDMQLTLERRWEGRKGEHPEVVTADFHNQMHSTDGSVINSLQLKV